MYVLVLYTIIITVYYLTVNVYSCVFAYTYIRTCMKSTHKVQMLMYSHDTRVTIDVVGSLVIMHVKLTALHHSLHCLRWPHRGGVVDWDWGPVHLPDSLPPPHCQTQLCGV